MDESKTVEGAEDHVHLPVDAPEKRRYTKGKDTVPQPVGCGGERHRLRADLGGEDLRGVCPRGWTPGSGEGRDE